jgi:hypothetical protein
MDIPDIFEEYRLLMNSFTSELPVKKKGHDFRQKEKRLQRLLQRREKSKN